MAPTTIDCVDETLPFVINGKSRTCNWISKRASRCRNCGLQFCPLTCGLCEADPPGCIVQEGEFVGRNGITRTCEWVGKKEKRCRKYGFFCPSTCGLCDETTEFPTSAPSPVPTTPLPSLAPTLCVADEDERAWGGQPCDPGSCWVLDDCSNNPCPSGTVCQDVDNGGAGFDAYTCNCLSGEGLCYTVYSSRRLCGGVPESGVCSGQRPYYCPASDVRSRENVGHICVECPLGVC
jgi:hypothetical protein